MILKYQQGGGIPPLLDFTVVNPTSVNPFNTTESSTTKSGKKDSDDFTVEDIRELINSAELLPNDSAYLIQQAASLLERHRRTGSSVGLNTVWARIVNGLNQAKYHKNAHEKAVAQAEKTGALSEVAITADGRIIGKDDSGKITALSLEQARSGDYRLLTNYDLKDENADNLSFVFDTNLLGVVANGIGMQEVNKLIKEAAMTIGTSEVQKSGYSVQTAQDMMAGLQIARQNRDGMPLAGLYKSKQVTKDQTNQVLLALDYIYSMLPQNAKTLLQFKGGSEKAAKELIFTRLSAQLNPYSAFDTDLILDASGNKPGSDGTKKDGLPDLTEAEKWLYGYGYEESFNLVGGTSNGIRFKSTVLSMTDAEDKPVGQTTLQKALKGGFNGILDQRSITMGNLPIDPNALDKVILKDGRIYKVELPLDQELLKQNIIAPAYNYSKNKEVADNEIKTKGITDKQEINKIYEKHSLPVKYDANGELITTNYATFGALHATALQQAFNTEKDTLDMCSYLNEISEEDKAKNALQTYRQLNGLAHNDESLKDWDYKNRGWEWKYDALYEGIIYIPVQANFANAKVGQDISPSEMQALQQLQIASDKSKQLITAGWNDGK